MDASQHRVLALLGVWAVCIASLLATTSADAAELRGDPQQEQGPPTSDGPPTTDGPSLAAIIAGCLGVVFGAVIARWQIKAFQDRDRRGR